MGTVLFCGISASKTGLSEATEKLMRKAQRSGQMRKDLAICLAEAKSNGARLPVTALVDQFYGQVQARGGNRWDTSSLMHLLAKD